MHGNLDGSGPYEPLKIEMVPDPDSNTFTIRATLEPKPGAKLVTSTRPEDQPTVIKGDDYKLVIIPPNFILGYQYG